MIFFKNFCHNQLEIQSKTNDQRGITKTVKGTVAAVKGSVAAASGGGKALSRRQIVAAASAPAA